MNSLPKLFLLITILFFQNLIIGQSKEAGPYLENVYFSADANVNGFNGSIDMKFAFKECYDQIVMVVGWDNLKLNSVKYEGKKYYAKDLGLNDFDKYALGLSELKVDFYIDGVNYVIGKGSSNYIQKDYTIGCFGETVKVIDRHGFTDNIEELRANFVKIRIGMSGDLSFLIKNHEKKLEKEVLYKNLMDDFEYANSNEEKLEILLEAKKHTDNQEKIDSLISEIRQEIEAEERKKNKLVDSERNESAEEEKDIQGEVEANTEDKGVFHEEFEAKTNGKERDKDKLEEPSDIFINVKTSKEPINNFTGRTEKKEIIVELDPKKGTGFLGRMKFVYAFENCGDEIKMFYTYEDVDIKGFSYDYNYFSANDLDLSDFDNYLIQPYIYFTLLNPNNNLNADDAIVLSNVRLNYISQKELSDCSGQQYKVGNIKDYDYEHFYLKDWTTGNISYSQKLIEIAKCKLDPNCNSSSKSPQKEISSTQDESFRSNRILTYTTNYWFKGNAKPGFSISKYLHNHTITVILESSCGFINQQVYVEEELLKIIKKYFVEKLPHGSSYEYFEENSLEKQGGFSLVDLETKKTYGGHNWASKGAFFRKHSVVGDPVELTENISRTNYNDFHITLKAKCD